MSYDDIRSMFGAGSGDAEPSDKKQQMLEKVRGLIAKADGTDNPHEADAFRAQAERLMLKYTIQSWELHEAATKDDREVEAREFDFSWYWRHEQRSYLYMMMSDVARHCRCVIIAWGRTVGDTILVAGIKSDLDYFDLLFTSVMLEMQKGLEPTPDPNRPMVENLVKLKESGQQWLRIAEQLRAIGQLRPSQFATREEIADDLRAQHGYAPPNMIKDRQKKMVHHLGFAGIYTRYCDAHDRPRLRTTPAIYQRSFASGFANRIWERLADMAKYATQEYTEDESSTADIVLADIRSKVDAWVQINFPRPESRGGRRRSAGRARNLKFDGSAMQDGRTAADRANLGNQSTIDKGRGSLPGGH